MAINGKSHRSLSVSNSILSNIGFIGYESKYLTLCLMCTVRMFGKFILYRRGIARAQYYNITYALFTIAIDRQVLKIDPGGEHTATHTQIYNRISFPIYFISQVRANRWHIICVCRNNTNRSNRVN